MAKLLKDKGDVGKVLKILDTGKTKQPDEHRIERAMSSFMDTLLQQ